MLYEDRAFDDYYLKWDQFNTQCRQTIQQKLTHFALGTLSPLYAEVIVEGLHAAQYLSADTASHLAVLSVAVFGGINALKDWSSLKPEDKTLKHFAQSIAEPVVHIAGHLARKEILPQATVLQNTYLNAVAGVGDMLALHDTVSGIEKTKKTTEDKQTTAFKRYELESVPRTELQKIEAKIMALIEKIQESRGDPQAFYADIEAIYQAGQHQPAFYREHPTQWVFPANLTRENPEFSQLCEQLATTFDKKEKQYQDYDPLQKMMVQHEKTRAELVILGRELRLTAQDPGHFLGRMKELGITFNPIKKEWGYKNPENVPEIDLARGRLIEDYENAKSRYQQRDLPGYCPPTQQLTGNDSLFHRKP